MSAPDTIYLQWYGDADMTYLDDDDNEVPIPDEEMDVDPDVVTWCVERIYDGDIEYRRVRGDEIVTDERTFRAVIGYASAQVKDNGFVDVDECVSLVRYGRLPVVRADKAADHE